VFSIFRHGMRFDHDACILTALLDAAHPTEFFNDACEHGFWSWVFGLWALSLVFGLCARCFVLVSSLRSEI